MKPEQFAMSTSWFIRKADGTRLLNNKGAPKVYMTRAQAERGIAKAQKEGK